MSTESQPAPPRGWLLALLLGSAALLLCVSMGVRQSFGLYLTPLTRELGWGRETFALAIAIQNIVYGVSQPFMGMLADRFGTFRVLSLGALLYALGVFAMSQAAVPLAFTLSAGLLVGVAQSATSIAIVIGAVGRLAPEDQRSRAIGITMTGTSFGQLVMLPFGQALIDGYGWQTALLVTSGVTLLMVPLALGFALRSAPRGAAAGQRLGEALGEAGRHKGYRLLTAGFFTCGFHVTFIATHLPSYLADQRFPGTAGATALALIGLFNIAGTYVWGHLGGRYSKKRLLSLIYFSRAVVISVFMLVPKTPLTIYVFAAVLGTIWLGTVALTSGLVGQIFGVQYLSTLFGIAFLMHQVGSFLGAWLGGLVYDLAGSYDPMWYAAIGLALLATAVNWPIDERAVARPARAEQAA